ncbi:MAG: DUF1460 domain-containing protein [Melioribacteraceae bacterium]|nr:DUF1460 domain-containing protein [Melioribacteraceae bacterium]
MIIRFKYFLILFTVACISVFPQVKYTDADLQICMAKFELTDSLNLVEKPINEVINEIAKSFVGTDYEASTLETDGEEELVVHLTSLDCYTFLEAAIVFARCIKMRNTNFDCFKNELENIRYRDGKLNGYPSRLHYFSDWIYELDNRKIGIDITREIGGFKYENKVHFMSANSKLYKQLEANTKFIDEMKKIEAEISSRDYFFIPEDMIEKVEDKIESGDILGITTDIDGLDIIHTGIAFKSDDSRIHLLHAPNVGKKVQISEEPLAEYLKKNKSQTGIMILRLKEIN